MTTSSPEDEFSALVAKLDEHQRIFRLHHYAPYSFQQKFHNAQGFQTENPASQRCLMAANGVGKTWCGAMETAMHLTGIYPDWYKGRKFTKPVEWVAAGKTNDATKMVVQKELFGDPLDDTRLGTGAIPKHCLIQSKITRKPGVPNAIQDALIRHVSGGHSKLTLMAYEQKAKAFMGIRFDGGWLDEEPPMDIWGQFIRGTLSRPHAILYVTFTPEEGLTEVVNQFMNDLRPGQAFVQATWDDAPHFTDAEKEQKLSALPPHQREMRSKGAPQFGSGLVFPFANLEVDPFEIPRHWPRVTGIDFGWDHPFGAALLAWDRDSDCVYVVADYRESRATPAIHAAAINPWGKWPVAWPHDGLNTEKGTGDELKKKYENEGLELLRHHATNPPQSGQKEGEGGTSVEASILSMYERMETGRWKVFKTCRTWLEEQRIYHRTLNEKGVVQLVKLRDDVISASRYAHMMLRHARVETLVIPKRQIAVGASNW